MTSSKNNIARVSFTGILVFLTTVLIGCSSGKTITADNFAGYSYVEKGDTANISWTFNNADFVKFEGYLKEKTDSIKVAPEVETEYLIKAFSSTDTLSVFWKVQVGIEAEILPNDEFNEHSPSFSTSLKETTFLSGLDKTVSESPPVPENVKIAKLHISDGIAYLEVLVLDRFGNHLQDFTEHPFTASLATECETGRSTYELAVRENESAEVIPPLVIIDDSYEDNMLTGLVESVVQSAEELNLENKVQAHLLSELDSTFYLNELSERDFKYLANMNDSYSALFTKIVSMDSDGPRKICYVAQNNDVSSLIYTPQDISLVANDKSVTLDILQIGNIADPSILRYLSSSSGGQYYPIDNSESISDRLYESMASEYVSIKLATPIDEDALFDCNNQYVLTLENDTGKYTDTFTVFDKNSLTSPRQVLALFGKNSVNVDRMYNLYLQRLASVMADNPDLDIQLIGHSSIEGNDSVVSSLSKTRAKKVAEALQQNGIAGSRIKLRGAGRTKPIYPFENTPMQAEYNRRVEIRWLTPYTLPFVIITEVTETEESAAKSVIMWEKRGYRAYYDRYLKNATTMYRTLLWGYSTEKEAEEASKKIDSLYQVKSKVW